MAILKLAEQLLPKFGLYVRHNSFVSAEYLFLCVLLREDTRMYAESNLICCVNLGDRIEPREYF